LKLQLLTFKKQSCRAYSASDSSHGDIYFEEGNLGEVGQK